MRSSTLLWSFTTSSLVRRHGVFSAYEVTRRWAISRSAVTARLVHGVFGLEDLGTHALHGVVEPMAVSRVRGLLVTSSRDEEFVSAGVPRLVGREEESGLLRRRWEQSKAGLGQVVFISGEASIGKSALVEGLRAQVRAEGLPRIAYRCSPYHTASALYPVITHIAHLLQFTPDDPPATKLVKLEAGLRPYGLPLAEADITYRCNTWRKSVVPCCQSR